MVVITYLILHVTKVKYDRYNDFRGLAPSKGLPQCAAITPGQEGDVVSGSRFSV